VNESLADQPMEIGRARTFSPGWFENESIWLHMEYKYMLELLHKGLYTEFYRDFKSVFVPFFDPEIYGRSTLENSSFIVSSANPDPSLHGNGFVARLSGATAEFISILHMMAFGTEPFRLDADGKLLLSFCPALPACLFTRAARTVQFCIGGTWQDLEFAPDTFSFMFLSEILVCYHNPLRKDTFGSAPVLPSTWIVTDKKGNTQSWDSPCLEGKIVEQIRSGKIIRIDIILREQSSIDHR
ncbi:MAG: hypothetical protein U1B83_08610, partial [Candidatus Cloacimonadaceae bacterium]|nr:hypothetical protein [Candidatus Cloacimonadaceae bacterium]